MATPFQNLATLSYNDEIKNSNIATGEIMANITGSKTAVIPNYAASDEVTFVISIVNSSATDYTGATLDDDLGGYSFSAGSLYPLNYVADSVQYYVNGELQPDPTVTAGPPLQFAGISLPANSNVILIYQVKVSKYAPLDISDSIENAAKFVSSGGATLAEMSATIDTRNEPNLSISKSVSPENVAPGANLTYTFTILNYGNTTAASTDNAKIKDIFDPILNPITVTFNDTTWTEGTEYTYSATTGEFETDPGKIIVPGALYEQDTVTGEWIATPGVSTLTVSGTV